MSGHVWRTEAHPWGVELRCVNCDVFQERCARAHRRRLRELGIRVHRGKLHLSCEAQRRVFGEEVIWAAHGRFTPVAPPR